MRPSWRLSFAVALAVVGVSISIAERARADVVRAGVDVESLVPAGMVRREVVAPDVAGMPARLVLSAANDAQPQLLVDVLVAADTAHARVAFEWSRRTLAREVGAPTAIVGDVAVATSNVVAFARDNIAVRIHRVGGAADVLAVARLIDAAILAAPRGAPSASAVDVRFADPQVGSAVPVRIAGDAIAVELTVADERIATVRRTATGWLLVRRAAGRIAIHSVAVDSRLRVARR